MLDTRYRNYVQKAVDKLVTITGLVKLHPNMLTTIAFIVGVISALFIGLNQYFIALILMWLSGLFDVIDGTVARLTNKSSKLGAFLDMIFDRMVESCIILGFYFSRPEFTVLYLLFFVCVLFNFSSFMLAATLFKNEGQKSMHYDIGLVERTETFLVFSSMLLWTNYLGYILTIFIILVFLTGIIRMYRIIIHQLSYPS